jgi:hypothetical protein
VGQKKKWFQEAHDMPFGVYGEFSSPIDGQVTREKSVSSIDQRVGD